MFTPKSVVEFRQNPSSNFAKICRRISFVKIRRRISRKYDRVSEKPEKLNVKHRPPDGSSASYADFGINGNQIKDDKIRKENLCHLIAASFSLLEIIRVYAKIRRRISPKSVVEFR